MNKEQFWKIVKIILRCVVLGLIIYWFIVR